MNALSAEDRRNKRGGVDAQRVQNGRTGEEGTTEIDDGDVNEQSREGEGLMNTEVVAGEVQAKEMLTES